MTTDRLKRVSTRLGERGTDPRVVWQEMARPEQIAPGGTWRVWYLQGGRGSGKTRGGAGCLADWLQGDTSGEGEYGICAPTYADAWTKCVEGESGLLTALGTNMSEVNDHRSKLVKHAWRTYGQVIMHNGLVVYIDSANEGGLRIQGRNLKGIWCDEIGLWMKWEVAWNESIRYAVRKGGSKIVATATPKVSRPARRLIRSLIRNEPEHGGVVVTKLRTVDNAANLSDEFLRSVIGAAQGTRLERQELEGELLDDVANARWTREMLERAQCPGLGQPGGPEVLTRAFIGVDPSDGTETSDEQAYTVVGTSLNEDPFIYVTEQWGGQEAPAPFARRCILKAAELSATMLVEKNHGGGWLKETFNQVTKDLMEAGTISHPPPVKLIWASQAKRTRAEPVSVLYERRGGLVRHAGGPFVELEDQMATFTGAAGERSPDRLDSLVWALNPFLRYGIGPAQHATIRKWAGQEELELVGSEPHRQMMRRRMANAHGGLMDPGKGWDLEDFAPKDDDGTADRRVNVVPWR